MASCTEKHNTVGHSIGRMLLRHGIHEFFGQGLPQGLSLPFEELGLRQIAYRTENGGGYMADGYARVSKRPGVMIAQNGPAATLVVAPLAEALKSSIPLVVMLQEIPLKNEDRNAFQEFDHVRLFSACSKWTRRVHTADRVEDYVDQAFAVACSGRPGPVVLLFPNDMLGMPAEPEKRGIPLGHYPLDPVMPPLDAVRGVIYYIETYDVTTVRASTPMYLLARVIKSMGIKMVLSGEGADEVFGGYLYFHKAPDARAFHEETVRKISKLHLYDCLRANKSLSAWGVEGRVPFLDKEFLDVAMRINPAAKMAKDGHIEKWILRKAFEDMLPSEIVWRQKEQFSDGVGYNWIDTLKQLTAEAVSDREMEHAAERFPINPPRNKEEYYYRTIFEEHFPSHTAAQCVPSVPSVACSTAEALAWDKAFRDMNEPSGRAVLGVHNTDLTHDTHRPETD